MPNMLLRLLLLLLAVVGSSAAVTWKDGPGARCSDRQSLTLEDAVEKLAAKVPTQGTAGRKLAATALSANLRPDSPSVVAVFGESDGPALVQGLVEALFFDANDPTLCVDMRRYSKSPLKLKEKIHSHIGACGAQSVIVLEHMEAVRGKDLRVMDLFLEMWNGERSFSASDNEVLSAQGVLFVLLFETAEVLKETEAEEGEERAAAAGTGGSAPEGRDWKKKLQQWWAFDGEEFTEQAFAGRVADAVILREPGQGGGEGAKGARVERVCKGMSVTASPSAASSSLGPLRKALESALAGLKQWLEGPLPAVAALLSASSGRQQAGLATMVVVLVLALAIPSMVLSHPQGDGGVKKGTVQPNDSNGVVSHPGRRGGGGGTTAVGGKKAGVSKEGTATPQAAAPRKAKHAIQGHRIYGGVEYNLTDTWREEDDTNKYLEECVTIARAGQESIDEYWDGLYEKHRGKLVNAINNHTNLLVKQMWLAAQARKASRS